MNRKIYSTTLFSVFFFLGTTLASAQPASKTGSWYMYFYNYQFKESKFGIQGDIQYRNWNFIGDLEQLLIRSGITFTPKDSGVMLTLGYGNITTGQYGDSNTTTAESRIYQEALIPQKLGNRFYLTHRFRYEQRFVENQDFRTRYRYNLFINIPITSAQIDIKTVYLAMYNELFINGQRAIGEGREVEFFDRNRTYLGLGYALNKKIKFQLGWMNQKTNTLGKGQLQFSLHHKI